MNIGRHLLLVLFGWLPVRLGFAADAISVVDKQPVNWVAITMFAVFVLITLWITQWAAKKTRSSADFYTAGGTVTGFQNGLAMAGDYMSAAAFLGITSAVMISGYDGMLYAIGSLVGWPVLVFLVAERLRNLGKYTFSDVVAYRFAAVPVRLFTSASTLVVVVCSLVAQMVGAGALIKLLFGLDYWVAVIFVGGLMMVYVMFGGMAAATWVQIIKAVLLLTCLTFMAVMIMWRFGFNFEGLFASAVEVKTQIAMAGGKSGEDAKALGLSIMAPGSFIKDPISAISLGIALVFGTAGLPHILMRFFTVPDARQARHSVLWAITWIGYCYILMFIIGFGAIVLVLANPQYADIASGTIRGGQGAANMAAVLVAKVVGGNVFMGFVSAVAFATILAVVAGLALSGASAVSHDVYAMVIKQGKPSSDTELLVSRVTTAVLGVVAVLLGIVFQKQNVAFMVSLAFAIAASANFPVLVLSLFWKNCTTWGAVIGGFLGLISSLVLTVLSPSVWVDTLGHSVDSVRFPYTSPALFSMTIGFVGIWLFSVLDRSGRAAKERIAFKAQQVRAETGLGASKMSPN